ncbi:hypothetical protein [Francisella sp. SYW-9]|uniref:hypothetical protein n=1 Tax=Francisella sp. SYW-9 TaxID=2610888 RepID=UPI00168CDABF|nr:hypothetical protein [Francisella sp. SYW-9]
MKLPQSERLVYKPISRSEENIQLLTALDTNPKNREYFPNGALSQQDIPVMIERFVGGYEKYGTPIFMLFDKKKFYWSSRVCLC